MTVIKRVGSKSVAKVFGVMYLIMGSLLGAIMLILSLFSKAESNPDSIFGSIMLFIFLTFGYGAIGWLGGYALGWLYNVAATRFGGIEMELEQK